MAKRNHQRVIVGVEVSDGNLLTQPKCHTLHDVPWARVRVRKWNLPGSRRKSESSAPSQEEECNPDRNN